MRITFSLGLAVLASPAVWGQPAFVNRALQTRPDFDFLYERLSGSEFVVRGKLLDFKVVLKRLSLYSIDELRRTKSAEQWEGGFLYTIEPQETLCRTPDLVPGSPAAEPPAGRLYIFVPHRDLGRDPRTISDYDLRRRFLDEFPDLAMGRDHLLYLRKAPHQEDLTSKNELDPAVTYYRTVEGDLGAVVLPDATHPERPHQFAAPLLSAVTAYCGAVKAPDTATKIRNLGAIKNQFDDPAWRQSVDAAINALQRPLAEPPKQ